jgi:SAM-dependent methyltransferase
VKKPSDVGADFDDYARRWRKDEYGLESGYDARGVTRDPGRADQVQRPGDEWGDVAPLREAYGGLVADFVAPGPVNVLEIGAGGGRSTAVLLDVLGDRVGEYHVVDVSPVFVEVLKERIEFPVDVHIVTDVDLSGLPVEHFDLCLAQSSWSHIGIYDQYRYLRELRRVLRPGAPVYVNGQFLLGVGNDWTWNRFVRRVDQIDRDIQGVFHEFTSFAAVAEMLTRLQYDIECINTAGFIARRGVLLADRSLATLPGPISAPFNRSPHDFLATRVVNPVTLPDGGPAPPSPLPPAAAGPAPSGPDRGASFRQLLKRIPGLRPLVLAARRRRSGSGSRR